MPSSEQIANCKADVKASFNNLIRGCYIRFEGSAANACARAYQSQSSDYIYNCEQTGTYPTIDVPINLPTPTPTPVVPIGYS